MAKYWKRPVAIEAEQWTGDNLEELQKFCGKPGILETYNREGRLYVNTLEGKMIAQKGDYIIKGVEGEFYPCKEDIFKKTYETDAQHCLHYTADRYGRWVSCEDRLPDPNVYEWVLGQLIEVDSRLLLIPRPVKYKKNPYAEDWFVGDVGWLKLDTDHEFKVIAWMPLPEKYTVEGGIDE